MFQLRSIPVLALAFSAVFANSAWPQAKDDELDLVIKVELKPGVFGVRAGTLAEEGNLAQQGSLLNADPDKVRDHDDVVRDSTNKKEKLEAELAKALPELERPKQLAKLGPNTWRTTCPGTPLCSISFAMSVTTRIRRQANIRWPFST